jgi:hypothetical protein
LLWRGRSTYFGRHLDSLWDRPDGSAVCSGSGTWDEFLPELHDPAKPSPVFILPPRLHQLTTSESSLASPSHEVLTGRSEGSIGASRLRGTCKCDVCAAKASKTHLRFFYSATHRGPDMRTSNSMMSLQQLRLLADLPPADAQQLDRFVRNLQSRMATTSLSAPSATAPRDTIPSGAAGNLNLNTKFSRPHAPTAKHSSAPAIETDELQVLNTPSSPSLRLPLLSQSPIAACCDDQSVVSPFAMYHGNRLRNKMRSKRFVELEGRALATTRSAQSYANDPLEFCDASEAFSATTGRSYATDDQRLGPGSSSRTTRASCTDSIIEDDGSVSIEEMLKALELGRRQPLFSPDGAAAHTSASGLESPPFDFKLTTSEWDDNPESGAVAFRGESSWNGNLVAQNTTTSGGGRVLPITPRNTGRRNALLSPVSFVFSDIVLTNRGMLFVSYKPCCESADSEPSARVSFQQIAFPICCLIHSTERAAAGDHSWNVFHNEFCCVNPANRGVSGKRCWIFIPSCKIQPPWWWCVHESQHHPCGTIVSVVYSPRMRSIFDG